MFSLTPNEKRCLQWAAAGKTSFEAGAIMSISPRTVDYHIHNACAKMGVHSRQVAIAIAIELGMFPNIRKLLPKLPLLSGAADPEQARAKIRRSGRGARRRRRQ